MANVLEYLPEPVKVIREFQAIATAEDPELSALWQSIADAELDQFIDEATVTGVRRWETNLGLAPKLTDTLVERRLRIKTRINEQPPYTYRTLDQKLATLCGERMTLFEKFLEDVPAASWSVEAITDFVNAHGSPITYSNLFSGADLLALGGWSSIGANMTIASGKATATGTGSSTNVAIVQTRIPGVTQTGRRYFMRSKVKLSQAATYIGSTLRGTTSGTIYGSSISNPTPGQEYDLVSTVTETASILGSVRIGFTPRHNSQAEATGQVFEMREPLGIELSSHAQIATLEARLGRVLTDQELGILLPFVVISHTPKDVGGYTLDVDVEGFKVTVRLALTEKAAYEEVDGLLERIVPLNMIIDLSLLYNQHDLLASYTHSRLGLYTHDQLRSEDISNLTYGMMEGQTISNLEGVN